MKQTIAIIVMVLMLIYLGGGCVHVPKPPITCQDGMKPFWSKDYDKYKCAYYKNEVIKRDITLPKGYYWYIEGGNDPACECYRERAFLINDYDY